jgi:iron complex outermembrane receptor protein
MSTLLVFENAEKLRSHGAEIEVELKTHRDFEAKGSYTFERTVNDQTRLELSNSPKHLAKLNFSLPIAPGRVFAGVRFQLR